MLFLPSSFPGTIHFFNVPDTWNPMWSVSTILVGLMSFMCEESTGVGSIRESTAKRKALAQLSKSYNQRLPSYKSLFLS